VTTDYSMEDVGQLKTRVEAFLEMMQDRKAAPVS
jgi:benzoyl-CoA reductase/2-hydroxyglutaryl-CoA dehydratase subunit BcrC/BadD/HgdB